MQQPMADPQFQGEAIRAPRFSRGMKHALTVLLLMFLVSAPMAMTLQEAFERAQPGGGYDKYLVLEPGEIYTGGLLIGPIYSPLTWTMEGNAGCDVRIVGNGAILDLQASRICISYCNHRLDIDDCVIVGGDIRFRGLRDASFDLVPQGSVRQVTFYRPDDYGIRLQGAGEGITLERNLIVSARNTGPDFIFSHGAAHELLPTGTNIAASVQAGLYGVPQIRENWSFHEDPAINADMLAHFSFLCEYG